MAEKTTIIPIGGGKGGVGKTMVATNLGIALSKLGHSTIIVDLDLGGSNLHSCLGFPNRHPGIGDYLRFQKIPFEELPIQTEWPNLKFIPGDGRIPFMANITYIQKKKLITEIKSLPARYVLLDLGAGTSFNTLDLFRISKTGLIVTQAEKHALLNMLTFLKNTIYRSIDRAFNKRWEAQNAFQNACFRPMANKPETLQSIRNKVAKVDREAAEIIDSICDSIRPRIILNFGNHPDELEIMSKTTQAIQQVLSMKADHFGFIFKDNAVHESMIQGLPLLKTSPDGTAATCIQLIAERIDEWWDRDLVDFEPRLLKHTRNFYQQIK